MNDFELRALYDRLVAARAPGRLACVAPEALLRIAAGEATESERLELLEHIAGCPDCRKELEFARAVADAGDAMTGTARRRMPYLAVAASILVLIGGAVLWRSGLLSSGSADVVRGTRDGVTQVAPLGEVAADGPIGLVWRAVPRATRYDIEVIAQGGALAYGTGVTDTATAVPATFLTPGVEYHWRVVAVLDDGRRVSSAAQPFRVRAP